MVSSERSSIPKDDSYGRHRVPRCGPWGGIVIPLGACLGVRDVFRSLTSCDVFRSLTSCDGYDGYNCDDGYHCNGHNDRHKREAEACCEHAKA